MSTRTFKDTQDFLNWLREECSWTNLGKIEYLLDRCDDLTTILSESNIYADEVFVPLQDLVRMHEEIKTYVKTVFREGKNGQN